MSRKQTFSPAFASFPGTKAHRTRAHPTIASRGQQRTSPGGGYPALFVSAVLTLCTEQSWSCQPKLAQKCIELFSPNHLLSPKIVLQFIVAH